MPSFMVIRDSATGGIETVIVFLNMLSKFRLLQYVRLVQFYTSSYVQELAVLADSSVHLLFRREDFLKFSLGFYTTKIFMRILTKQQTRILG